MEKFEVTWGRYDSKLGDVVPEFTEMFTDRELALSRIETFVRSYGIEPRFEYRTAGTLHSTKEEFEYAVVTNLGGILVLVLVEGKSIPYKVERKKS